MAIRQTSIQPGATESAAVAQVPPASREDAGASRVSSGLRNVVLGAFLPGGEALAISLVDSGDGKSGSASVALTAAAEFGPFSEVHGH